MRSVIATQQRQEGQQRDPSECCDCRLSYGIEFFASEQDLFSLRSGISLVHPVCAEVVSNVEHLHVRESQRMQGVIGRFNVRTMPPGAASAVQNDELVSRQGADALAKR